MKQKIIKIKKLIIPILKKSQVKKASIFGSYARGEEKSTSDIDMMIEFGGKKTLLDLIGLQNDLEDKVGKKFDLTTFKSIHPAIKKQVFKEQVLILQQ